MTDYDDDIAGPRLVADNPGLAAHNLGKRFKKRPDGEKRWY